VLFNKAQGILLQYPGGKQGAYSIPDGVTSIQQSAFSGSSGLTSVTIPNSVTSIGNAAFSGSSGLTSVTIPNSVTSIELIAFQGCTGLTSVTIPNSVTSIERSAFQGCTGLTSVTIPNSVTSIERSAFEGCTGLTSVTSLAEVPPDVGGDAFSGVSGCFLVPETSIEAYRSADGWKSLGCIQTTGAWTLTLDCGVTPGTVTATLNEEGTLTINGTGAMANYDFYRVPPWNGFNGFITNVAIGDGVTSIGDRMFLNHRGLTSVTIPNSVTSIGQYAFYGSGLTSVTIPNSVTSIGRYAFCECTGLTSVTSLRVVPPNAYGAFSNVPVSSVCLYVPQTAISAYNIWEDFSCIQAVSGTLNITFDSQGGSAVSTQYALSGYKALIPADPTRSNYVFSGWYKEAEYTTPWNFDTDVVESAITLYAKWTPTLYSITYVLDGNAVSSSNPANYTIETPTFTLNNPVRTGYTFTGWTGSNGTTADTSVSIAHGSTGNKTYTANWTINSYTVEFNSQGGSAVASQTIPYNGKVTEPATEPTRAGYYFYGWFKEADCTNEWDFGVDVLGTANVTLYAKWSIIPDHAVHFDPQGGSAVSSEYVQEGNKATTPTDPTRAGYTFGGWYREASCTNAWNFGTDVVTSEIKLYAKWTINTYTITYNLDGGSVSSANPMSYTVTTAAITLNNPTKTNYTFAGWTGSNGTIAETSVSIAHGSTGDKTYASNWTPVSYTITYNLDGGTASSNPTSYNVETAAFTLNTPTKTGYTFTGWTGTDVTTAETSVSIAHGSTGDKTYTANWTINTYVVTFNSQGGSEVAAQSIQYNDKVVEPADPTLTGYYFDGWFKDAACYNAWDFGVDAVWAEDVTLYAKWTTIVIHVVTFNSQGGSYEGTEHVEHGNNATAPAVPTRVGYTFGGWYTEAYCINAWDFGTAITSAVKLYAKWTINTYTVTFVDYNGTQLSQQTVNYGSRATAPTSPPRTGYTFNGWDKAFNYVTRDLTVTAKYDMSYYMVRFSAGAHGTLTATVDGNAITSGTLRQHGESVVFTATPAEGYKVSGWTLDGYPVTGNTTNTYTSGVSGADMRVAVSFTKSVSVLESDRVIPQNKPVEEATVIAPMVILAGEFTAGPNPVSKQSGIVKFYRQGRRVSNSELRIYDAAGNVINKVKISDKVIGTQARRQVGAWDLCDRNGRIVSDGAYLVKGVLKTSDGKSEKVSVILSVR
jgi:uncharacterized repeat protein (TIGR02543 family)